ncbi:ATP-binding cassette subfamily B protein [Spirosoma lacussanchae]|uniref:peptidase domain-containing ABC transporter n=1 Tax=Spirosoma lacussanchae TaxID=1884249 RepID=UPI001107EE52|nr:peptidase domain-containing ABC transporter [Spirosoma lacussanchae]
MNKRVRIKQRDITDCGAACLASVAAHYRLLMPVARVRQLASTDQKGTNVLGLIEAAHKMGFQAKGVKGPFESLGKVPKPAIAHVIGKNQLHHYVVIYDVTSKYVVVMDPADGRLHRKTHDLFRQEWTGVLVLLVPDNGFQTANAQTSVGQRFWQLLRPHWAVMLQALFGAVIYTLLGLSTSIYVQKLVDNVLVDGNRNLLNLLSVVMIGLLLLQVFIDTVKDFFNLKTGQQIDAALILGYYKHLLTLPQSFFDTMRVGEIISRVNDAVKIRTFINDTALGLVVNGLVILFSFGLMFTYYWKLAVVMGLIVPLYGLIYYVVNRINRTYQRRLMEDSAELESQLVESLNAVSTIKRFGLEAFANEKTETRFIKLLQTIYQSGSSSIWAGSASEFTSRLFTIIVLWLGAFFVLDRQITPGELLSFYALIGYFTGPAAGLIGANRSIQDARIAADRLFEILDLEKEQTDNKIWLTADLVSDIRFENVTFRYGTRITVFDRLTLTIPHGQVTAIVGESGSGKSTLLSLVQGLYPLQEGSIHIGDYDIKYLHPDSLRKVVGVVPQKIDLFAGTVLENIAIGDPEPDMQRIISICRELGILDFIEKLPTGFQTYLGENGVSLSGGQRQRIAIARALYRDPAILILDEATSALDSGSEQFVQRTIQHLRQSGRTVIIIAHRLSTVRQADKIIVLEQGKIVEEGSHTDLLQNGQTYRHYWQQQIELV